jgi:hypothetical protein
MRLVLKTLLSATILAAVPAQAAVTINFDTVTAGSTVDQFYNGGTDSLGGSGPNYGVSFTSGDWVILGGYGETSPPQFAYNFSGNGGFDVASGFTTQFSFTAGAFTSSAVSIYDGVGGTGTLLAQITGITDSPFAFGAHSVNFAGTARSVIVTAGSAQFAWDDVTLGALGVPEPASWALTIGGFGLMGATMRRRRAQMRVTYA